MTLRHLEPIESDAPREDRQPDDYVPMQKVTHEIAFEPDAWNDERKEKVKELFVTLAPEWHTRGGEARMRPTQDALDRGEVAAGGTALEIGSGTGIHTPMLLERFDYVISLDIVDEMLRLTPEFQANALVRADAGLLPLKDDSVDAIICVNAYLFPEEYGRVLRPGGRYVMVATSGDQTPIYLPPEEVVASLERVLGPIDAVTSGHGWSIWTSVTDRRPA